MAISKKDLIVGTSRETVVVNDLTRTQLVMYAGASGDYNPLHSDDLFTVKVAGFPGVFAHGMLTMGLTGKALTDWFGDGRLLAFGVQFRGQVWPGDSLTATLTVRGLEELDGQPVARLDVATANQDGAVVLTGSATARLDG